jgi:hypothetical protein
MLMRVRLPLAEDVHVRCDPHWRSLAASLDQDQRSV